MKSGPGILAWLMVLSLALSGVKTSAAGPLVWDAVEKSQTAKAGDLVARFVFTATNISSAEVTVDEVKPGCGCTVARLPSHPWRLAPGASSSMELAVDLRGVSGTLSRGIAVTVGTSTENLGINVVFPAGITNTRGNDLDTRLWNQEVSRADHQAVFKDTCVRCHLVPAFGKLGERLYRISCGICHEAKDRAPMVPDLQHPEKARDAAEWRKWISEGKEGTLMPGFAAREGGPLDVAQIESLVNFLQVKFPGPGGTNVPPAVTPKPPGAH